MTICDKIMLTMKNRKGNVHGLRGARPGTFPEGVLRWDLPTAMAIFFTYFFLFIAVFALFYLLSDTL